MSLRFWEVTKRQRDKEERLRRRSPDSGTVFYETPEGEQGYITPAPSSPPPEPAEPEDPSLDPTDPSEQLRIVEQFFQNQTVWNFNHKLGNTPVLTIWRGAVNKYDFGTQEFGTTPFGGGIVTDDFKVATHIPETTEVDLDNISVDWGLEGDTSGKVVAVG